jgi:hypothetical protein
LWIFVYSLTRSDLCSRKITVMWRIDWKRREHTVRRLHQKWSSHWHKGLQTAASTLSTLTGKGRCWWRQSQCAMLDMRNQNCFRLHKRGREEPGLFRCRPSHPGTGDRARNLAATRKPSFWNELQGRCHCRAKWNFREVVLDHRSKTWVSSFYFPLQTKGFWDCGPRMEFSICPQGLSSSAVSCLVNRAPGQVLRQEEWA